MDEFLAGIICGGAIMSAIFVSVYSVHSSPAQIEQNMQKQAISHGAARYEVDTNGVVSFKWNK